MWQSSKGNAIPARKRIVGLPMARVANSRRQLVKLRQNKLFCALNQMVSLQAFLSLWAFCRLFFNLNQFRERRLAHDHRRKCRSAFGQMPLFVPPCRARLASMVQPTGRGHQKIPNESTRW